jgi:outer membrane cobalamin receptor
MTISEALIEMKNNKIVRRANCNTSYCFDSNTKKFGMMIKYNQIEGVKYDIKYKEQNTHYVITISIINVASKTNRISFK